MAGDPVAWRAIEQGWSVVDSDGNHVGYVDQVTGDLNGDIFDGITFGDGGTVLTRARYVPAEQVGAICEGEVTLRIGADEVASLAPFDEPVSKPLESLLPEQKPARQGGTPADAAARIGMNQNRVLGRMLRSMLGRR